MSDSEHPSDGATESVPPIQHSSQFDTVFELFKGYVDSRLHELSTASASNTESSKSLSETKKLRREAEASKLKGGEIRDTKTLNLSRNIVSLQVLVDVSRFSPGVINLTHNKNVCCGLKKCSALIG